MTFEQWDALTDEQQTAKLNELARVFYYSHGYQIEAGYRFDEASHPQERGMFNLASIAMSFFVEGCTAEDLIEEDEA